MKKFDRRDFLKVATSAGVLGTLGLAGCAPSKPQETAAGSYEIEWTEEADVVIVGGGGAGFCAAIEAGEAGSSVIIIEKSTFYGGDTVLSNGMILAAETDLQQTLAGYTTDTAESFMNQQLAYAQGFGDADMIKEMCQESAESVDFMLKLGRVYTNVDFVPPVWAYDNEDTFAPRCHWVPSETGGNSTDTGHFAVLLAKVESMSNVTCHNSTEVTRLITNGDREVIGVECKSGSRTVAYHAKKGVVLATCSFGENKEMAQQYNQFEYWGLNINEKYSAYNYRQNPANTGDGIRMAQELGADLSLSPANVILDMLYFGGVGSGFYQDALGIEYTHNPYYSTAIPGKILVNSKGNRFVQEDADWGYVCQEAFKEISRMGGGSTETTVWAIQDQDHVTVDALSSGYVYTAANENYTGLIKQADSLETLAEAIGAPVENFVQTIQRWNAQSSAGVDTDYDRRTDFGTIETGPFYAFPFIPNTLGSLGGLKTDIDTRVLTPSGEAIPRLFAAGTIASGMWVGPFYPGCGWAILGTVHWGRKAGKNVAALDTLAL